MVEQRHSRTGRLLTERDSIVNIADIAELFARTLTPFAEIHVGETTPIIELKSNYGLSDLRDDVLTENGGTITNASGEYLVTSGTDANGLARLSTVEYGRYVSGQTGIPGIGVRLPDRPTGSQEMRWGYFNDTDGFGFGEDADGLFVWVRKSGSDVRFIRREDWHDPMDGTGPSGQTLDIERLNIYRMPFRWYGSGPISFEVSTVKDGVNPTLVPVAVINSTNGTIIENPNLPLTCRVENGGTADSLTAYVAGRQYAILGRYDPNRRLTGDFRIDQSIGTTFVPLVTFRQKPAFRSISVKTAGLSVITTEDMIVQIRVGGTLTGASWVAPNSVPATETALEFDKSATAISGGQSIYLDTFAGGQGNQTSGGGVDVPQLDLPINTPITLCGRTVSGTATVTSTLRGREEW